MSGLERGIVGRAQDFLIQTARQDVGPWLRGVYEEGMEAWEKGQEGDLVVRAKNPLTIEPTTSADKKIDDYLRTVWQAQFPDIPWYSEDSKDKRVRGLGVSDLKRLPWLVVVDAIDGSGRLANHSDRFSSSFALLNRGRVVMAVVYKPVGDTIWTAEATVDGAFKNGQRMRVSDTKKVDEAIISTAFAWNRQKRGENQKVLNRLVFFVNQVVGTASSVLDGVDVAQGQTAAHVSIGLKPWDKA